MFLVCETVRGVCVEGTLPRGDSGTRLFPSCVSVPSRSPISLSRWTGKESDLARRFQGPGPRPASPPPAPRWPDPGARCLRPQGTLGNAGQPRSGGQRAGCGGPSGFRQRRRAQPFLSWLVPPCGVGSRSAEQEAKARQRGVQPGSGALWVARAGPGLLGSRVSAVPAARTTTECFPRGPRPPGRHRCLSW